MSYLQEAAERRSCHFLESKNVNESYFFARDKNSLRKRSFNFMSLFSNKLSFRPLRVSAVLELTPDKMSMRQTISKHLLHAF